MKIVTQCRPIKTIIAISDFILCSFTLERKPHLTAATGQTDTVPVFIAFVAKSVRTGKYLLESPAAVGKAHRKQLVFPLKTNAVFLDVTIVSAAKGKGI